MVDDLRPPWRIQFDTARDPYSARNALGLTSTGGGGGGGGAPDSAQYIVAASDATLTAERVATNTSTITWDFTTPGQAKANAVTGGGGNVSNVGTPTLGQYAKWTTATTIQGVAPATVLSDIGAQPAGSYQPLDADLTAIAALTGVDVIYYRSAANTWTPVTVGTGLSFTGGTLANTVSTAGSQPLDSTLTALAAYNTNGLLTQTAADTFTGRSIAVPAAGISITNANGVAGNPTLALANDLAALEALGGTNTIYYRSGSDAWSAVTFSGLTFSGGVLTATAGGAPVGAQYITAATDATLTAERVLTNTATVTWDVATAGQVKANAAGVALSADFPAGAWTNWTPTVTASFGTITSSTVNIARYTKAGKTITAYFDVTITNAGTAADFLLLTVPVPVSASGGGMGVVREVVTTGAMGVAHVVSGALWISVVYYAGGTIIFSGNRIVGSVTYESA